MSIRVHVSNVEPPCTVHVSMVESPINTTALSMARLDWYTMSKLSDDTGP